MALQPLKQRVRLREQARRQGSHGLRQQHSGQGQWVPFPGPGWARMGL